MRNDSAAAETPADPGAKTRVLVADNHDLVRRGLAAVLNGEPDLACCGTSGCDDGLLAAIAATQPQVVLIDVSPVRGARLELLPRIRKAGTDIRVVALASGGRPELEAQSRQAGAAAFVAKTAPAERILEAVRRSARTPERDAAAPGPERSGARRTDGVDRQVIELIGHGLPDRAIALRLRCSVPTIAGCRRRIRRRLNKPTASQLVEFCARWTERTTLARKDRVAAEEVPAAQTGVST